jgi:hypothetical protein
MVAFSTIKPGDVLWDCHREKMGNTKMTRMGTWRVVVYEVNQETRSALVSWNGNPRKLWGERKLKALRRSKPGSRPAVGTLPHPEVKP